MSGVLRFHVPLRHDLRTDPDAVETWSDEEASGADADS